MRSAAAPAREHRIQLPGEIDGVLDAGVHAEAPGGGKHVRRIAGDEDARGAVAVGHQQAAYPRQDRDDLEGEIDADDLPDGVADLAVGIAARPVVADDGDAVAVAAVDGDEGAPHAHSVEGDEAVELALVVQRLQRRGCGR